MELTISLLLLQTQEPDSYGHPFKFEVEAPDGGKEAIDVYFVNKGLAEAKGEYSELDDRPSVLLRRGTSPLLAPILVQMNYYRGMGYEEKDTATAAILYAEKMLGADDLSELLGLLGATQPALVGPADLGMDKDYYFKNLSEYGRHYQRNRWIAMARCLCAAGETDEAIRYSRGVLIAKKLLSEGPVFRTGAGGKREELYPAITEVLPEVVGLLEMLKSAVPGRGETAVDIANPLALRVLSLFEETLDNSPIRFLDENSGKGPSRVRFGKGSAALIRSVLSHMRVDIAREENAVRAVLEAAQKKYGELGSGHSFGALVAKAQGMDKKRVSLAMREMARLLRVKQCLRRSVVGARPMRASVFQ